MKRIAGAALSRLVLVALLVVGIYVVALKPIVVPVGLLIALGVLALKTRPRGRPGPSRVELMAGMLAYPIACIAIYLALETLDAFAAVLLILPTTGLLFALLLGRLWLAIAPVALVTAVVLAAYISDPSCSACDGNSWGYSIAMSGLLFAAPSVLAVEVGVPDPQPSAQPPHGTPSGNCSPREAGPWPVARRPNRLMTAVAARSLRHSAGALSELASVSGLLRGSVLDAAARESDGVPALPQEDVGAPGTGAGPRDDAMKSVHRG